MAFGLFKRKDQLQPEPVDADVTTASPPEEVADEQEKTEAISATGIDVEDTVDQLQKFSKIHKWDLNLPQNKYDTVNAVIASGDVEKEVAVEQALLEENSPYPEVRAAVRNYDEPDLPCNTIRAWVIGMLLTTVASSINLLFSFRNPSISVTTYCVQLVAYPLGLLWDKVFPNRVFKTFGVEWNLVPGPFNMKEHTIIVVMANASFGGGYAYATDILLAQEVFYGQYFGWGFQMLLIVSTQMIGFGMAGLIRRFLVWPAAMIWPSTLVNTVMFYSLHDHRKSDPAVTNGWSIGRYRWFLYVFSASFCWYFFPGFIAQFLSYFVFPCWIAPDNVVVNQIFGGVSGFGIIPITFDWTIITGFLTSPLIYPFFAIANMVIGVIVFMLITGLGIHYSGALYSEYLPIQDSLAWDNTGAVYNVSRIMTPELTLNETAYKEYSPLFLSTNFALCYGVAFASYVAIIVHTGLYNGREIWERYKLARKQPADVHLKIMRGYKDSPEWWYGVVFIILFAMALVTCLVWDTHFTWWAFLISMIIPIIFVIPIGMIQAVANWQIGTNVITEFVYGYMQAGRPLGAMMFKCYGYITMSQALYFIQDLKMGHYMKIPPRTMFFAQCIATLWSSVSQIAVFNWALGNIPNICTDDQADEFTCPGAKVFYTASIIWGAIGPKRIFSPGQIYSVMQWYWLLGALLPVCTYLLARKWPRSIAKYAHTPLMLGGLGWIPPATVYIYLCWGAMGTVFNFFIKRRWRGWWMQYNYITSAALDTGLFISTIFVCFCLFLTHAEAPQWWGNIAVFNTMDMLDTAIRKTYANGGLVNGTTFGPKTWS